MLNDIREKKWGILVSLIIGIVIIIISILSLTLCADLIYKMNSNLGLFDTFKLPHYKIPIDFEKKVAVGDIIYYFITIVTICMTTLFSYMLYKSSVTSNELARALKEREEERDSNIVVENASLIYYDLITALNDVMALYVKNVIGKDVPCHNSLSVREEVLKNITALTSVLSSKEIEKLYSLYRLLLSVRSLLISNDDDKKLTEEVGIIMKEIIKPEVYGYIQFDITQDILALVKLEYFEIIYGIGLALYKNFDRIEDLIKCEDIEIFKGSLNENFCFSDDDGLLKRERNGCHSFEGKFQDGNFITGVESLNSHDNEIVFRFNYVDKKIVSGELYKNNRANLSRHAYSEDYWEDIKNIFMDKAFFIITKYDRDGTPVDGYEETYANIFFDEFNNPKRLKQGLNIKCGNIINGKLNGECYILQSDPTKNDLTYITKGEFLEDSLVKGTTYSLRSENYIIEEWVEDTCECKKWKNWQNTHIEKATFFEGAECGKGTYTMPNGNVIYDGGMKMRGIKHGKGVEYFADGSISYEGEYKDGLYHGMGKLFSKDESSQRKLFFEGEFINGNIITGFKHCVVFNRFGIEIKVRDDICIYRGDLDFYRQRPDLSYCFIGKIVNKIPDGKGKVCIDDKLYSIVYEKEKLINMELVEEHDNEESKY